MSCGEDCGDTRLWFRWTWGSTLNNLDGFDVSVSWGCCRNSKRNRATASIFIHFCFLSWRLKAPWKCFWVPSVTLVCGYFGTSSLIVKWASEKYIQDININARKQTCVHIYKHTRMHAHNTFRHKHTHMQWHTPTCRYTLEHTQTSTHAHTDIQKHPHTHTEDQKKNKNTREEARWERIMGEKEEKTKSVLFLWSTFVSEHSTCTNSLWVLSTFRRANHFQTWI